MKLVQYNKIKTIIKKRILENRNKCNEKDPFLLQTKCFGKKNNGRIIYFIRCAKADLGFCAVHRALLIALYFAEKCNFIPVVSYGEDYAYAEKNIPWEKLDPYEYFFEQPSDISIKEALKSKQVIVYDKRHFDMMELFLTGKIGEYGISEEFVTAAANMQKKYIRLNSRTDNYINKAIQELLRDEKVLGVHVRGSDFKRNFHIHPKYVSINEFAEEVKTLIQTDLSWKKIFLATDDEEAISIFQKIFEEKLLYYQDVVRTKGMQSVAFSKEKRKNHRYQLGKEILRDMYTLAKCDGLIAGVSQVSICARITKRSYGEEYDFLKIIDKGINLNNKHFIKKC